MGSGLGAPHPWGVEGDMRASASYPSACRILRGARARPPSHHQPCGAGRSQGLRWLPTPRVEHVRVEEMLAPPGAPRPPASSPEDKEAAPSPAQIPAWGSLHKVPSHSQPLRAPHLEGSAGQLAPREASARKATGWGSAGPGWGPEGRGSFPWAWSSSGAVPRHCPSRASGEGHGLQDSLARQEATNLTALEVNPGHEPGPHRPGDYRQATLRCGHQSVSPWPTRRWQLQLGFPVTLGAGDRSQGPAGLHPVLGP